MNPESYHPSDDPLARSLRRLQPSATPIEPTTLFYQAGFEAGRHAAAQANAGRKQRTFATAALPILAATLAALMVGPAGYRLGRASVGFGETLQPASSVTSEPVYVQSENHQPDGMSIAAAPDEPQRDAVGAMTPLHAPAPSQEAESNPAARHAPAESVPQPWSQLCMAVVDWLGGDAFVHLRTSPDQRSLLAGTPEFGGDSDLFADRRVAAHLVAAIVPGQAATKAQRAVSPPAPLLRAGDWKEVIDSKDLN